MFDSLSKFTLWEVFLFMYAQIFVEFDKKVKKFINMDMKNQIMPAAVHYGFTNDRKPDIDSTWYNLSGKPGAEICKDFHGKVKGPNSSEIIFEGFNMEIDFELAFEKVIYKVSYSFKHNGSGENSVNKNLERDEFYIYNIPGWNFWEAVMY